MAIAIDLTQQGQDMSEIQEQLDVLLGLSNDTADDTEVTNAE